MKKEKFKYYTLDAIDKKNAHYNVIFGERSNGKTYAVLKRIVENYFKYDKEAAIIRRWQDDFKSKRGQMMFAALSSNGVIEELSGGLFDHVDYYAGRFYMACYMVDEKTGVKTSVKAEKPFAYAFALSAMEHDKSTSYPNITTILFDEFITRDSYFNDEFVIFMNVLSTIVRLRKDVKIYMLGNTVNKYCPYFAEMGLTNIKKMQKGDIDIYKYGETELRVAVEYTGSNSSSKESNVLFAFNNPKLSMISHGSWEIDIYPHLPQKYADLDILFMYFIMWNDDILQCEIIYTGNSMFTYIHRKTTEIKDPDNDIVYTTGFDNRPNYYRNIKRSVDNISKRIGEFFRKYKVFYQDNEVGEIVRNYLLWCDQN